MTWPEFRTFLQHLPPTKDSAYHRATHPKSWWWTPEMDFYAAILHSLRAGNWQRGGGQGEQPQPIERPLEYHEEQLEFGADQLEARKKAFYDAMERRRREVSDGFRG